MKIIDLLNRIANGEEVPKKIKFDDIIFEYDGDYYNSETNALLEGYCYLTTSVLNDEVEVIEEDNKIEKLELVSNGSTNSYALLNEYGTKCGLTKHSKIMCDKINEIIDKINKENK